MWGHLKERLPIFLTDNYRAGDYRAGNYRAGNSQAWENRRHLCTDAPGSRKNPRVTTRLTTSKNQIGGCVAVLGTHKNNGGFE